VEKSRGVKFSTDPRMGSPPNRREGQVSKLQWAFRRIRKN
jgi:hypothetical protein